MIAMEQNEIYTGTDQWKVEGAGYCEHCRRHSYCTEIFRKGGCRVRRKRLEKEGIKKKIEMALSMGLTPEQIGVTPEMIKEYGVEVPEVPAEETVDGSPEE